MRDILEGLAEILESVRGMLSGPAPLEGSTGSSVLEIINDSLELLVELEAGAPDLVAEVAWLRRRFFAAGVALEDLTPGFQYSAATRITRRPVLTLVAPKTYTKKGQNDSGLFNHPQGADISDLARQNASVATLSSTPWGG